MSSLVHAGARTLALALVATLAACGGGGPSDAPVGAADHAPATTTATALAADASADARLASAAAAANTPVPTPAGVPAGAATIARIGPAGGTLQTPDGKLTLTVPPNALDRAVDISVQPISNQAHGAKGGAWRLAPAELEAAVPMTLRFALGEGDIAGTVLEAMTAGTQDGAGYWHVYHRLQRDTPTRALTVQSRRLGDWSVLAGVQIKPDKAEVVVGNRLRLTIIDCPAPRSQRNADTAAASACTFESALLGNASDWAVNGVTGGSPAIGTVVGLANPPPPTDGVHAEYTAPAAVPAPNPVAVSVNYTQLMPNAPTYRLVANITVLPVPDCSWLHERTTLEFEVEMHYAWTGAVPYGTLSMNQHARMTGRMQRVFDNDLYGVWQGTTTSGQVSLDDSYSHGDETDRLYGTGTPAIGASDQFSGAEFVVDYRTCTYTVGGKIAVIAATGAPNDVPRAVVVGGFMRGNVLLDDLEYQIGLETMPVRRADDPAGTYYPGGLYYADTSGDGDHRGQAQVRWLVDGRRSR